MHPRTINRLKKYNTDLPENVKAGEAVGYLDFLTMLKQCKFVMTDSGGVQEEAIILRKPCITLNNTTEREETILLKANRLFLPLVGGEHDKSINDIIEEMLGVKITINPYGENVTAKAIRVISIINNRKEQKVELQTGNIRQGRQYYNKIFYRMIEIFLSIALSIEMRQVTIAAHTSFYLVLK